MNAQANHNPTFMTYAKMKILCSLVQQFVRQPPEGHPCSSPFALLRAHGRSVHHLHAVAFRLGVKEGLLLFDRFMKRRFSQDAALGKPTAGWQRLSNSVSCSCEARLSFRHCST
jgi:hypothetical protein